MDKLTDKAKPPTAFNQCQLCGYTNYDIVQFRMWFECDENDKVVDRNNVLITCKQPKCDQLIKDHPRLYVEAPWGAAAPGAFMLLCRDCKLRDNFRCTSPKLKANGGTVGLEVKFANFLSGVHVCFTDGTGTSNIFPSPATVCEDKLSV